MEVVSYSNFTLMYVCIACKSFDWSRSSVASNQTSPYASDPPGAVSITVSGDSTIAFEADNIILPTNATESTSLSLLCNVEAGTALYYQWMHGGVEIEAGLGRDTLQIVISEYVNVTGSYQCTVSNMAGKNMSNSVWIIPHVGKSNTCH